MTSSAVALWRSSPQGKLARRQFPPPPWSSLPAWRCARQPPSCGPVPACARLQICFSAAGRWPRCPHSFSPTSDCTSASTPSLVTFWWCWPQTVATGTKMRPSFSERRWPESPHSCFPPTVCPWLTTATAHEHCHVPMAGCVGGQESAGVVVWKGLSFACADWASSQILLCPDWPHLLQCLRGTLTEPAEVAVLEVPLLNSRKQLHCGKTARWRKWSCDFCSALTQRLCPPLQVIYAVLPVLPDQCLPRRPCHTGFHRCHHPVDQLVAVHDASALGQTHPWLHPCWDIYSLHVEAGGQT